jgi:hypothetical protein
MITITRTPSIAVPLYQLNVGMTIKNEDGHIGKIIDLTNDEYYPIKVLFDGLDMYNYYTAEGFENPVEDCHDMHALFKRIELVEQTS